MPLSWDEIRENALGFAHQFKDAKVEEKISQAFLIEFFKVFGQNITELISSGEAQENKQADFEYSLLLGEKHGYIDFLWKGKIAIEMKSQGKSLDHAFEQLQKYVIALPAADMPDLLMVSDLQTIRLVHRVSQVSTEFPTFELDRHVKRFAEIAGYEPVSLPSEQQIEATVKTTSLFGDLYKMFEEKKYTGHPLEVFLLRVAFCAFCEDSGLFEEHSFYDYLSVQKKEGLNVTGRLQQLFSYLDIPIEERKLYQDSYPPEVQSFPYLDGGLFHEVVREAPISLDIWNHLKAICRRDWGNISPAIFGSIFQSVNSKEDRRAFGEHYTSEENILKVIKPLFLDDLRSEFDQVKGDKDLLEAFHEKIASLKFLDPACGCGNFLIVAYRELRKLELDILRLKVTEKNPNQNIRDLCKVSEEQFYGIEINGFPCEIAKAGMLMVDHQMNQLVSQHFGKPFKKLPLTESAHIFRENSLKVAWDTLIPANEISYIFGNPPFVGSRMMDKEQKKELRALFSDNSNAGELDYVCCWYKKATKMMTTYHYIKTAFVATNSIYQGIHPSILWKELFQQGIHIDFAYRTFKWSNEAPSKAAVQCVIVGFSLGFEKTDKFIVNEDGKKIVVKNINAWLKDAPSVFVESRSEPLCDVPPMRFGNMPCDNGHFLLTEEEKNACLEKEPSLSEVIKRFVGSEEFLHAKKRYCFWLHNVPIETIAKSTILKNVLEAVQTFRKASKSKSTQKAGDTPALFLGIAHPYTSYLLVPGVSSEKRSYVPIGFMDKDVIASNATLFVPQATLYHFGILTSSIHNDWMRTVAGRLEMRYRYSKDLVYNNFPWAENVSESKKAKIEKLAQAVLDARSAHPDLCLADLYNDTLMPPDLRKAHNDLDKAVMSLYGYKPNATEQEIVADLLTRYQNLLNQKNKENNS